MRAHQYQQAHPPVACYAKLYTAEARGLNQYCTHCWALCHVPGMLQSSSAWYRDYQAAAAPSPSPYALGPGPSPSGSGLQLLSSDLVIGDLQPPSSSVFFNESGLFWTSGPVVTSFYR